MFSLLLLSLKSIARGQHSGHVGEDGPSPYHYEYNVQDDKEYLDFGAQEEGDGQGDVHGHYHVQLPDGRLQHVSYHVDDYNGYIADVSYDGHAEHPSYHGHGGHKQEHSHGGGKLFGKNKHSNERGSYSLPIIVGNPSSDYFIDQKILSDVLRDHDRKTLGHPFPPHNFIEIFPVPAPNFPTSGHFSHRVKENFASIGNEHSKHENPINRHGKSGRQQSDQQSINFLGLSSNSKPIMNFKLAPQKTITKPNKPFVTIKGQEPNNFLRNFEKSADPDRDFDSFSPIFGKVSNINSFTEKTFDKFGPISQKNANDEINQDKSIKQDAELFNPFRAVNENPETNTQGHRQTDTLINLNQVSSSKNISQATPRFKSRRIGFGKNHPVLQSLKKFRRNRFRKTKGIKGSTGLKYGLRDFFMEQVSR